MSTVSQNSKGEKIFSFERLEKLVHLLLSPDEIPTKVRIEIALALDLLYITQLEDLPRRPGRRPSESWTQAAVALALVERFGISRKEAIAATLHTGTKQEFERVSRACDKLSLGADQAPRRAEIRVHESPIFAEAVKRVLADRNN